MELLNAVLVVTGCENTEQLKNLSSEGKQKLANSLEKYVPSGLASIEEWNELLLIFTGTSTEKDNKIAKKKLLGYLRGQPFEEKIPQETKNKWWHLKIRKKKESKQLEL